MCLLDAGIRVRRVGTLCRRLDNPVASAEFPSSCSIGDAKIYLLLVPVSLNENDNEGLSVISSSNSRSKPTLPNSESRPNDVKCFQFPSVRATNDNPQPR